MTTLRRIWNLTATPALVAMTGAAGTAVHIAVSHGLI